MLKGKGLHNLPKISDGSFSDTLFHFGHFAEILLKQTYAYKTRIRLGKRAKMIVSLHPQGLTYNDEKITRILSNSYVFQAVSRLEFAT